MNRYISIWQQVGEFKKIDILNPNPNRTMRNIYPKAKSKIKIQNPNSKNPNPEPMKYIYKYLEIQIGPSNLFPFL